MKNANQIQLAKLRAALNKATHEASHLVNQLARSLDENDEAVTPEYDDLCALAAALEDLTGRFSHLWPVRKR